MSSVIDFDSYKLELVDANEGDHQTQLLPMETIETADMRYCRTVRASGFSSELDQCYAKFHAEIVNKAKSYFGSPEYWK